MVSDSPINSWWLVTTFDDLLEAELWLVLYSYFHARIFLKDRTMARVLYIFFVYMFALMHIFISVADY